MKKILSMALAACVLLSLFAMPGLAEDDSLRVVTTIFPPYDFVRSIAGDAVDVSMLLPPGSESHSFEPSPQDIIKIQRADVFIYVGGEADAWVDRILGSMDTSGMTILSMLDMVDAVAEEIVEGMEHGHDHDHGEFDPDAAHDRALTDWAGSWSSLAPHAQSGALDAYIAARAEESGATLDEARAAQEAAWHTDFDTFMLAGDRLYIDFGGRTISGAYAYEGFAVVESDHGGAAWYQYALTGGDEGMPAYVMFNDHGTGTVPEDGHDEHEHGFAHTHIRYGDESFDALVNAEGWSPFFIDAAATPADMLDTLLGHSHSHDEEETELDEHVWTSPRNAMIIVDALAKELGALDGANADLYAKNAQAYINKLAELDAAFADAVAQGSRTTLLFGDRFPFRYLADAYGLSYYAAFPGCATETEASASTIAFLIDKAREEALPVVFQIEFSGGKIADVICESTGARKLEMHSCHNVSRDDFAAGVGYLDLMRRNVDALKEALQ